MERPYLVRVDLADSLLREKVIDQLFQPSYMRELCVFETEPTTMNVPYDLVIFDPDWAPTRIIGYCARILQRSQRIIFIHVGRKQPVRCDALHLIGISREFVDEYFPQLIGFCYLSFVIRESSREIGNLIAFPHRG